MSKPGWGGSRPKSGARSGLSTRVKGFDRLSWPPAPVAVPKNKTSPGARRNADEDEVGRIDDNYRNNGSNAGAAFQHQKERITEKLRIQEQHMHRPRGAPMTGVRIDKRRGKATMSIAVYRRLMNRLEESRSGKAKWKTRFKALSKARGRVHHSPSKEEQVAVVALLQSYGVSASSVPHVLALMARFFLGKAKGDDLVAPSTATNFACLQGAVLEHRIFKSLSSANSPIPFYVGTDTTSRGGSIASYIVSFVPEGETHPVINFLDFDQSAGSDAQSLANGILALADRVRGALFAGLSSDAPATMVGIHAGVGELVSRALGRFLRHDTCEHHASACVARVLENIWPPQINVPSVTQLAFLAWYLVNDNWARARSIMLEQLRKPEAEMDTGIAEMLRRMGGTSVVLPVEELAAIFVADGFVRKPDKPNSNRWGTQADMIDFVFNLGPLLAVVFDEIREFGGAGSGAPGSFEAMAAQWIKWYGSRKLRALQAMSCEFLALWRRHHDKISLPGQDLEAHCYNKVFSRPMRALLLLVELQDVANDYQSLASFSEMIAAFGEDQEDQIAQLYIQLYATAIDRVKRNHGRYLTGVYAYAAFGDPLSAVVAWEAFSHWKKHVKKPKKRTKEGKLLEQYLRDAELSERHEQAISLLTNKHNLDSAWELVKPLCNPAAEELSEKQRLDYVASIRHQKNAVTRQLCMWIAALSSTQPVEKTFLDYDNNVSSNSGGKKSKKSAPSGKAPQLGLVTAKVRVARTTAEVERSVLDSTNAREKEDLKRVQAKRHIISAVEETVLRVIATPAELSEARTIVKAAKRLHTTPQDGISPADTALLAHLNAQYNDPTFRHVRKKFIDLINEGSAMDVNIDSTCFASDDCLRRASRKGAPGTMLACGTCVKRFHKKCLVHAGIVDKSVKKDARVAFTCPSCLADMPQ